LPQADRLITTMYRWVRFLFHPLPLAGFILFALSGFYPLSHEWGAMKELFSDPALVIYDNPVILVKLYVLLTLLNVLHELSHGLTCKHFGGSVHRMGIMFYLAIFIFYTDASGSWSFPEKYKRIAVALAGPLVNLICMALCFWIWHFQKPHIPPEQSVWFLGGYFCLFITLFNFLPLIKMDGYFVLMDLTGIPNLREKAFSYLWQKMSSLMGLKPSSESRLEVSHKEAWILVIYSVSGILFTTVFLAYPFFEFARLVLREHPSKAALLFFGVIVALTLYNLVHRLHQQLHAHWHREYIIS
jgi:putative peptide zinc metalloprotease protein